MKRLPWVSWGAALVAAYALKRFYSRAAAEDLAWILAPTARAVGWLRGETLTASPGAGWTAPDGSYVIAPACAGVNFLVLVLVVSVLGFAHRLRSPWQRLAWWIGSLLAAYAATVAVNTLRILAAVELYRIGPVTWLSREQEHRLLGTVLYLGALWGLFGLLDRLTPEGARSGLAAAVLVPGVYLGMTVAVPLLNGASGERFVEHAMMVSLTVLVVAAVLWRKRWKNRPSWSSRMSRRSPTRFSTRSNRKGSGASAWRWERAWSRCSTGSRWRWWCWTSACRT